MNVFLIETPHQLLNAVEARERFKASGNVLICVLSKAYSLPSFKGILKDHHWDTVYPIRSFSPTTIKPADGAIVALMKRSVAWINDYQLRNRMDHITRRHLSVGRLFLGNYNVGFMRHIANRIRCEEVYLLDDGTATLRICEQRRSKERLDGLGYTNTRWRVIRERLAGLETRSLPRITFFTTYDLQVADGDRVVKNDYSYFRGLAAEHEPLDEVFFLGQPMVEDGIIEFDTFRSYLRKVKGCFGDKPVTYLPHKREKSEKVEILSREIGFGVRRFEVPIEYQMSVRGTRPKILASFFSSALENSRIMFGSLMQIKCFRMEPSDFLSRGEFVSLVYDYYSSKQCEGFEVIG